MNFLEYIMTETVDDYWDVIEEMGYKDAPLIDQYNLVLDYQRMVEQD